MKILALLLVAAMVIVPAAPVLATTVFINTTAEPSEIVVTIDPTVFNFTLPPGDVDEQQNLLVTSNTPLPLNLRFHQAELTPESVWRPDFVDPFTTDWVNLSIADSYAMVGLAMLPEPAAAEWLVAPSAQLNLAAPGTTNIGTVVAAPAGHPVSVTLPIQVNVGPLRPAERIFNSTFVLEFYF